MRKFKILVIALVVGSASLFAFNTDEIEKPSKEIRNEIVKLLQQPAFTIDKDITVVLKFTFSSEGEIVVICPGCENQKIVNYIRKNLNYKKFKNPGERNKVYLMPLKIQAA